MLFCFLMFYTLKLINKYNIIFAKYHYVICFFGILKGLIFETIENNKKTWFVAK